MPLPYYVSPEQMMQDKAEYAKKGIAKGRSIVALEYIDGGRKVPTTHHHRDDRLSCFTDQFDDMIGKDSHIRQHRNDQAKYADIFAL